MLNNCIKFILVKQSVYKRKVMCAQTSKHSEMSNIIMDNIYCDDIY